MHFDRSSERDEIEKINLRRTMNRSNKRLIATIVKRFKSLSKKYLKLTNPLHIEEVSRRFALLTPDVVLSNFQKINQVYDELEITMSSVALIQFSLDLIQEMVIVLPDIGPSKCILGNLYD